jgi:heptosyltransferase-2
VQQLLLGQVTIERTLIVRLSSIGDIVLSSPLLRALHRQLPNSRIDYVVKSEFADLIRHNPHISQVIEFPAGGGLSDLQSLRSRIHAAKYDLIVDIHGSLRSRYLCFGAPRLVRVRKRKFARFLLVHFKWNLYSLLGGAPNVTDRYLETTQEFGIHDDGAGPELFLTESAISSALHILAASGIRAGQTTIGICPSARHANKMWLKERFAEVAGALSREYDAPILLFGSEGDTIVCKEVELLTLSAVQESRVVNLAGRTSLLQAAALMDHCSIIITNDSGLMHIASARKRKAVAIFGPTVREFGFFPPVREAAVIQNTSLSCRPCTHIGLEKCPRGHFRCMKDIPTLEVLEAARRLMKH